MIIELWTKRKFKCDCGNSKFGAGYCKFLPSKDSENEENAYNQNFKGKYCTCGRPYHDPDAEEQVEMIQCCICEDWFQRSILVKNPLMRRMQMRLLINPMSQKTKQSSPLDQISHTQRTNLISNRMFPSAVT